jgi:hypothetical protein
MEQFQNYSQNTLASYRESTKPGNYKKKKTSILGIAHILQEVLIKKNEICNGGNSITYTVKFNYRIAAVLCALEAWLVSGI